MVTGVSRVEVAETSSLLADLRPDFMKTKPLCADSDSLESSELSISRLRFPLGFRDVAPAITSHMRSSRCLWHS